MSDLIKREDAIKAVEMLLDRTDDVTDLDEQNILGAYNTGVQGAINMIKHHVPSADRPQEWIPCSERLPEIGQKVLASTKKTVFTQVFKGYHSDPKIWAWENNRAKRIEAWQPLPKPWKGADDE